MPHESPSSPGSKPPRRLFKRLLLAGASAALAFIGVVVFCRVYAASLGIEDREFRYEYEADMWRADAGLGFVNRAHFDGFCWGSVRLTTDEHGFRGTAAVSVRKPEGVTRIIGIGDSVTWGTGVNAEDSFLGVLQARLARESRRHEVINAGVVGYSTLLEVWYLERDILRFEPDIVLINLCYNDLLPTNDPFGQVREVCDHHLTRLIEDPKSPLSDGERRAAARIREIFRDDGPVRRVMAPEHVLLSAKVFLELPVDHLFWLSRRHGFRLIYLLIPPRNLRPDYELLDRILRKRLDAHGAEYLDLRERLAGDPPAPPPGETGWLRSVARSAFLRDLDNIFRHRRVEKMHETLHYLDHVHPTRKGNRIIAGEIHRLLGT